MSSTADQPLDFNNIQGEILPGFPKPSLTYVLFQITNPEAFRTALADLVPLITSTAQVIGYRQTIAHHKAKVAQNKSEPGMLDILCVNIAFSQTGLNIMGITEDIKDPSFVDGQLSDAKDLGDTGSFESGTFVPSDWLDAFMKPIHGAIVISGPTPTAIKDKVKDVENIFGMYSGHGSLKVVLELVGQPRPKPHNGHEHFGFLDGISHPAVEGFDITPNPGQQTVPQGIILLGRPGDEIIRPKWAVDGSFLVLRHLSQLVPEFDKFLIDNPIKGLNMPPDQASELLGARMVGRWKSGAPIDMTPFEDEPSLGIDPARNNNFRFEGERDSEDRCPFAAHIRKTNPRADLEDHGTPFEKNRIVRRGIQFGPEVTKKEREQAKTTEDRGLIFACYQSNIGNGFKFIQQSWANETDFPHKGSGLDPIIGQTNSAGVRQLPGTDPFHPENNLTIPMQFVVSRGGEYFFTPSISTLRDVFALNMHIVAPK